ncbi:hypothetical protein ACP26L_21410 [Paenibacillus sp. S-38]|uniref:hypothetical protein n=1 Tax=Paenibacillus sp. S-38 TaxID=3416710 RepID=UPI003CEFD89D
MKHTNGTKNMRAKGIKWIAGAALTAALVLPGAASLKTEALFAAKPEAKPAVAIKAEAQPEALFAVKAEAKPEASLA